jgi:hypothetical protein
MKNPNIVLLIFIFFTSSCADLNYPLGVGTNSAPINYPYDPYGNYPADRTYGEQDYYYREQARQNQQEKWKLMRERERLQDERDRLERSQRWQTQTPSGYALPQLNNNSRPPERERCPAGFHETTSRCSDRDRKKGCKDLKLPQGLRCINR